MKLFFELIYLLRLGLLWRRMVHLFSILAPCCYSSTRSTIPLTLHGIYLTIIQIHTWAGGGYGTRKTSQCWFVSPNPRVSCQQVYIHRYVCSGSESWNPDCSFLPTFSGQPLSSKMFLMLETITGVWVKLTPRLLRLQIGISNEEVITVEIFFIMVMFFLK